MQVHDTWILRRVAQPVHPSGLDALVGRMKRVKFKVIDYYGCGRFIRLHGGQIYNILHLYLQAHLHPPLFGLLVRRARWSNVRLLSRSTPFRLTFTKFSDFECMTGSTTGASNRSYHFFETPNSSHRVIVTPRICKRTLIVS
jgi:hypothetical protein